MRTLKKYQKAGQYVWTGQNHTVQKPTGHYNVVATDGKNTNYEDNVTYDLSWYKDHLENTRMVTEQPIEPLYGLKDPVFNLAFLGAGLANGATRTLLGDVVNGVKTLSNFKFKVPSEQGRYYRYVGKDAIDDYIETGMLRTSSDAGIKQNSGDGRFILRKEFNYNMFGKDRPWQGSLNTTEKNQNKLYVVRSKKDTGPIKWEQSNVDFRHKGHSGIFRPVYEGEFGTSPTEYFEYFEPVIFGDKKIGYIRKDFPTKQSGGTAIDPNGFWDKRNIENGKVIIPSNRITMKGVNFPVLGVSDTGDTKLMLPNGEYKFNGNNVTEYKMEKGGKTTIGNTSFDMMDKFKRTIMSPQYATQVDNSQQQFQSGGDWVNAWNKSQSDMRSKANYLMGDALATMYDQAYNPIISEQEYTDWYKNPNFDSFSDKSLEQYRKDKDNLQNKYGLDVVYNDDGSFLYRDKDGNEYGDMDDFYNEKYSELSERDKQIYDLDKSTDAINTATSNLSKMTGMPNLQIGTFMHNKINGIDMPHAKWGRNWEYVGRTYGEDTPSGFNPNDYTSVYKKGRITAWSTAPIQQSPVPTEEQKPERERRNPYRPLAGIEGYITSPEQLSDVDWGKRGQMALNADKIGLNLWSENNYQSLIDSQVKKHNSALAQQKRDDWRTHVLNEWDNTFKRYKSYDPLNPEFQFNAESNYDFKTQYTNWLDEKKMYNNGVRQINRGSRQGFSRNPQNIYDEKEYWDLGRIKRLPFARGGNWKEMQEISLDPNTEYVSRSGTERTIDYGAIADILRSGVRFATGVGYGIEANKSGLTSEQLQAANLFSNNQQVRDPGDIAVNPTGVGTVNPYNQTEIQHFAQYGGRTFDKGGVYHNVTLEELKKLRDGGIKYKII